MSGDLAALRGEFRNLVRSLRVPLEEPPDSELHDAAGDEQLWRLRADILRLLSAVDVTLAGKTRDLTPPLSAGAASVVQRQPGQRLKAAGTTAPPVLPGTRDGSDGMAELEDTIQELRLFGDAVSHDLRRPVRAIDHHVQVLREEYSPVLGQRGSALVEQVLSNTQRMTSILNGVSLICRVTRSKLRRERVDLSVLAQRVISDLRIADPSRRVEVTISDRLSVQADRSLVTIVMENLLSNAWKFSCKRAAPRITFAGVEPGLFAISDNGVGFDSSTGDRMFQPFQRLHSDNEFDGIGIGLAIAKRAIERQGGRLWARSVPDGGATFYFTVDSHAGMEKLC